MSEEQKEVTQEQEQVSQEQSTQEAQVKDNPKPEFTIPTEALDFVGEGKKYKSAEDALKSVPHAQEHIKTLEAELAEARDELTKRRTTQELIDELKSGYQQENTTQSADINQDTLEQLVQQKIEQTERQKAATQNANSVASKFTEKYGDGAESAYNSLAKESGLTVQQLNNLAATSPNAVLKLAGLSGRIDTPVAKPTGSINTQALKDTPTEQASARVPRGASTKDLVKAWKAAGEKIRTQS